MRFSALPATAGRNPPCPPQASTVLPGLRALGAVPGLVPVAAAERRRGGWGEGRQSSGVPGPAPQVLPAPSRESKHFGSGSRLISLGRGMEREGDLSHRSLPALWQSPALRNCLRFVSPLGWFVWSLQSCGLLLYRTEI